MTGPRAAAHAGRAARPARRRGARARGRAARARRARPRPPTAASAATPAACAGGWTSRSRSCTGPQVLFLDEPTTGLDPTSRAALWREVRALNDEGTTVFLTTQYLEEAEQLADRVGIIAGGRLVAEGTPSELKARVGEPTLHVELADAESAERRARGARAAGRGRAAPPRRAARASLLRTAAGTAAIAAGRSARWTSRRRGRVGRGGGADARRRLPRRHGLARWKAPRRRPAPTTPRPWVPA